MDKHAVYKIAEEYYQAGLELALVKEAGLPKQIAKKLVQSLAAGSGAYGGALVGAGIPMLIAHLKGVPTSSLLSEIPVVLSTLTAAGGGSMLGAKGGAKAFDLAHSGGSKLLNKLRR